MELVYFEHFATKEEAMSREYHIKQLKRSQKQALIDRMDKSHEIIPFELTEGESVARID